MRDIPLLVVSCDRYSDLWEPFLQIFRQYWADCPFPLFLGSNHKISPDPAVTTIAIGDDRGWGAGLQSFLDRLDAKYVLMFLEDFFLEETVDTANVLRLAEIAVRNKLGCLRLTPNPPPHQGVEGSPGLGWILPGDPYRVSTQVALWRVETLASLLRPNFTAWDFELKGSLLSEKTSEPFWSVQEPVIRCRHAVERGLWLPTSLATCQGAGINVDLTVRRAMTNREIWRRRLNALKGKLFWSLPISVRRKRWLHIAEGR